ncbi:hypothetical protein LPB136_00845 [Tenacibaculum todarodis]|uniref:Uncharacterized protein n=1 Tax=Tenacibaculum todarodis TaxID=1850252 RepID=A0A1L3JFV4_9FLAO|nr:PD40 domain-containing protein [Tenacibaculum todarodis]APG64002.1 hypothetical protein LPB136_00845 [Tenacibaculum todarodis]
MIKELQFRVNLIEERSIKKTLFSILILINFTFLAQNSYNIKFELVNFTNVKYNDFAPTVYKDGILFVSDRDGEFYNLYYSDFKNNLKKIKIKKQKHHIGQVFYDKKNKLIYLTKSSGKKSSNNKFNLAVYKGKIKKNKIFDLKKLSFCNPEFSYGHAQILNNKLLIHTNEGGVYSLNEYSLKNDQWVKTRTIFTDTSPILNPIFKDHSTIIFASKRIGGIGGIDLYKITKSKEEWSKPINLKKFNTPFDDLSLIFTDKNKGYISSNRIDNKDHIFKFSFQ